MFNVGDYIVYPMHGAGVIESIEERAVLDEKQSYYIIKMPGEVKVMVPTAKAEEIGVRDIIDGESAQKVMKVLEKGRGWSLKQVCTGKGNGNGGCGAKLLIERGDIYVTHSYDYGGGHERFFTFKCKTNFS